MGLMLLGALAALGFRMKLFGDSRTGSGHHDFLLSFSQGKELLLQQLCLRLRHLSANHASRVLVTRCGLCTSCLAPVWSLVSPDHLLGALVVR